MNYREIALCEILEGIIIRSIEDQSFSAEEDDTLEFLELRRVASKFIDTSADDITDTEFWGECDCVPVEDEGNADFE